MESLDLPVDPPHPALLEFVRAALTELQPAARAIDLTQSRTTERSAPDHNFGTERSETLYGTPSLGFVIELVREHDECQGMPRSTMVSYAIRAVGLPPGRSLVYADDLLDGKPGFRLAGEPSELAACLELFFSRCTPQEDAALRALRSLYGFTDVRALVPRPAFQPNAIDPASGGDVTAAVQAVDNLLRVQPDHPTARWFRAQLYARAGDAAAAKTALAQWRAAHPDDSEALIALAHVCLVQTDAAALSALEAVPESDRTLQHYASRFEAFYRLGRYADALSALGPWAVRSEGVWGNTLEEIDATLLRMRLHDLLGDRVAALRAWHLALTISPHYAINVLLEPRGSFGPEIERYLEPSWVAELRTDPRFEALMRTPSGRSCSPRISS